MKIKTGKGSVTLVVLLAIWSVSAIASLPGLAVSPILGDLNKVFPKVTDLEIQMLTSLPSLLIIPFVLLSGKLSEGRDKLKILIVGLSIFFLSGVACLFARSMAWLIVISCILGVGAGMVIPLSMGLIVDYFTGDSRVRQLGYSSAINNLTLVVATAVTGYLAEVNWHLPFLVYTLPGISLALSFVMAMNYLAVMICPFIMDMFRHLFHTHSDRFPFFFNAALVFALAAVTWFRRGNFTLGLDESYYKN